jgi:hypothetical protein
MTSNERIYEDSVTEFFVRFILGPRKEDPSVDPLHTSLQVLRASPPRFSLHYPPLHTNVGRENHVSVCPIEKRFGLEGNTTMSRGEEASSIDNPHHLPLLFPLPQHGFRTDSISASRASAVYEKTLHELK